MVADAQESAIVCGAENPDAAPLDMFRRRAWNR